MSNEQTNTSPAPKQPVSDMVVLRGGDDFTITHVDGTTQTVFVRLLPVSEMKKYLTVYDEFSEMCALATKLPVEKFNTVAEDSLYALYGRITEINDPRFDRWLKERASAVEKFKALRSPGLS